jgi:hypothetical protein
MNKKTLIIWIPMAVLLANIVVYMIVTKTRPQSTPVATSTASTPPLGPPRETADDSAKERDKDREERALARKATGVAALDAGDYDRALIAFTEAREILGDKAHVGELLRVTEDLRRRARTAPMPAPSRPAPAPAPPRPAARAPIRHVATREPPAVEPLPSPPPPASPGLLIVTTVPRGLLVHVDEAPLDLTPMRANLKRGSHRVALLDGGKKVFETTVEVKDGAVTTLVKDLSAELDAEPARPAAPALTPSPSPAPQPARAQEEAPRPRAAAPAATTRAAPSPAPRRPAPSATTGAITVTSPGLYGVVWINGRPRGYPPLEARDLPPGRTKVEVRVNGVERRSSTVMVQPGSNTPVKLLSLESAP